MFLASTKRGQSDGSAIPMGAPISQEVEASLRQPLLRELLRLPILPRLLELPLSLLSVIRQQAAGSRQQGLRSGRLPDWLKMKNADAPAVKREAEEDWS